MLPRQEKRPEKRIGNPRRVNKRPMFRIGLAIEHDTGSSARVGGIVRRAEILNYESFSDFLLADSGVSDVRRFVLGANLLRISATDADWQPAI